MHFILCNHLFADKKKKEKNDNNQPKEKEKELISIGNVAQMVERSFRIRKARGSIPLISILEREKRGREYFYMRE